MDFRDHFNLTRHFSGFILSKFDENRDDIKLGKNLEKSLRNPAGRYLIPLIFSWLFIYKSL